MKVSVHDINEIGKEEIIDFEEDIQDTGVKLLTPVAGKLKLTNFGSFIKLEGSFKIKVLLICTRCLDEFEKTIEFDIDEDLYKEDALSYETNHELTPEELRLFTYEKDIINISDIVRENFIINLPLNPLCRDNCKGLCPVCGVNLNKQICRHI